MSKYEEAIERLIEGIRVDYSRFTAGFTYQEPQEITVSAGRKFDKLISDRSVWGFIAKADGEFKGLPYKEGDVFKAASYRAPAKHVRGSIYAESQNWFAWTGPNYL